ncbi:MAG: hypothetical protein SFX74_02790 [Fimbriimonadaceae bacterium]|nr:hypothetical protein [Fimbriimonadaceae bacterium]
MKLSPLPIYLIGLAIALIAASYGFFHQWMPNTTEAARYNETADQLQSVVNQRGQAQKRVDEAKRLVEVEAAKWRAVVATRTPGMSRAERGIDLGVNPYQLAVDTQGFRNDIQRAINAQIKAGGVKVVNAPFVPGPDVNAPVNELLRSFYNFPPYAFPVLIFDLGQVTVEGSYEQIKANVNSYSKMPRYLAVADGLRLDGTGSRLTGTYNLSVVGFIRAKKISGPVPDGAGGAPAGGVGAPGGPGAAFGIPGGGAPPGGVPIGAASAPGAGAQGVD